MTKIHFAFLKDVDADWCRFHDSHGTITHDVEKVSCWHCLGWLRFGPGKDINWDKK